MNIITFIRLASNKIISRAQWYDRYWGGVIKFWRANQFNLDCINLGSNSVYWLHEDKHGRIWVATFGGG